MSGVWDETFQALAAIYICVQTQFVSSPLVYNIKQYIKAHLAPNLKIFEEEKKLMRRVDLRIMTLCSLLFLFKSIDSDNISNARIMNRGTDMNIMTQLG